MTKRKLWIPIALLLCAALIAGFLLYNAFFVTVGGTRYRKDLQQLDLSYQGISGEVYDAICQALPECEILWTPAFQGTEYPMDTRELTVTTLSQEDIAALDRFPDLAVIHAEGCTDYEALLALAQHRPECQVLYQVVIGDREYRQDSTYARIPDADPAVLKATLPALTQLDTVLLTGKLPDMDAISDLQADFPHLAIAWQLDSVFGQTLNSTDTRLDLTNIPISDAAELESAFPWLPNLEEVNLCGTGLPNDRIYDLIDAYPQIHFTFDLTFGTATFRTDAEEIDLSWIQTTPEAVEAIVPYFSNLNKVIMVGCGIENEAMDALNRRHEDIKFVWQVSVGNKWVRTDITSFIPFKLYVDCFQEGELDNLKYCTDIIALDLGHQNITSCEFVAYMPNLKYLVLADTKVQDLTPLTGLTDLVFLEIFVTYLQDYEPLLTLTGLRDLNLSWTYGDYEIIAQMPWLERVWWGGHWHNWQVRQYLQEKCPNTLFKFDDPESTGSGWRTGKYYYEMRDALGMFYME